MMKLKLMTVVGTRPEIIRLSEVIKTADECFEHILVHTGQNYDYELNQIFFEELGIRQPDVFLKAQTDSASLGDSIGKIISQTFQIISDIKPDAFLVLGDTNSCLSAYAAKRLKVPIFHMEAGNRCFDQNVPEEINRKIVDHISDVNMAYTEHSRRYLLSEGIKKEYIFVTGSPMREVLFKNLSKIKNSQVLSSLHLEKDNYVVVSAHREENIDNEENFNSLMNAINWIADNYRLKVIYSVHPRTRKYMEQRNFKFSSNVISLKPLGFHDYIALQQNAYVVISDSGTLSEESAMMNFPAVLIRTSTERPESIDRGTVIIGGVSKDSIVQAISLAKHLFNQKHELPHDYQDLNVSTKVVRIIQSYVGIINRFVWMK